MSAAPRVRLPLARPRILFIGGKGGVGKTTIASALAVRGAEAGERVLLVSTDPAHSLGDLFGTEIGGRERELRPNLVALEIDPEEEADRYLSRVRQTMRDFVQPAMHAEIERQMELTRQSPGAEEAALIDRVAALMEEARERYDRVIFDTAPTGHTLRLLALPEIMSAWTDGLLRGRDRSDAMRRAGARLAGRTRDAGAGDELSLIDQAAGAGEDDRTRRIREVLLERRRRFAGARRTLLDETMTAFLLVLVPEKLPILESVKALEALRAHRVPVAGMVINRVLPDGPLGDFLETRRAQEREHLARIARELRGLPSVRVPLLPRDVQGWDALRQVGALL